MNPTHDIGNGLTLRRAAKKDAEALSEFNGRVHSSDGGFDRRVAAWTRDLFLLPHPTLRPEDFVIVEESATGRVVSSLNLIPQTWLYEGIEFDVGRIELVGTLPEYRGRGLVRAQFEEIHRECARRNVPVQAITGIPYFYRKFGYEMALDLHGGRFGFQSNVPKLNQGEDQAIQIRAARAEDLDFIAEVYSQSVERYVVACKRSREIFRYELNGASEENINRLETLVLERAGESLGYFQHQTFVGRRGFAAVRYELKRGISWLEATPAVVRYLWSRGKDYAKLENDELVSFSFFLGAEHPVYEALGGDLPVFREPYAWYLRVPDLPGFIRHIAPALEKRLANSVAVGYNGKIRINRYATLLTLIFERGKLVSIEETKRDPDDYGDLGLPDLTILQTIFGRRSFDELCRALPDAYYDREEARVVFNILFPRKSSDVIPLY